MNVDGSNQTRLTTTEKVNDVEPAFSPDGSKIAFRSARDGNFEIYSMNADGTNPVRLTENEAIDRDPTYSPDGSRIAFSSIRDGNFELYYMNADGSMETRITTNTFEDARPSWGNSSKSPPPPQAKLKVAGGNILVGSPGDGLILRSPNGTLCLKIGIDNAGALTNVVVPCP
jgi:dipeptidyl aminopeptidase/acylaminoacyl peptidase